MPKKTKNPLTVLSNVTVMLTPLKPTVNDLQQYRRHSHRRHTK